MINAGQFGDLGMVALDVPWWREQSYYHEPGRGSYERDGGGFLISQAIHTIDLGFSLTGPVKSVLAMAKTTRFHDMKSEDYVVSALEFVNGAVGSLIASTASFPGTADSIRLFFERTTLRLEAGQLHIAWRDDKEETYGEEVGTGGGADPMAFTYEWHQQVLQNFAESHNGNSALLASGDDALLAHKLIDSPILSATSGTIQHL
jgi:predicted dehydrogenase